MTEIPTSFFENIDTDTKNARLALLNRSDLQALWLPAWRPLTADGHNHINASKYGGLPWLAAHESWPECPLCHRPAHLFLQLNLAELPTELGGQFGSGLLQFFYCKSRECPQENKLPPRQQDVCVIRNIDLSLPGRTPALNEGPEQPFGCTLISGWEFLLDFPHPDDLSGSDVKLDAELGRLLTTADIGETEEKLSGWPMWLHYPEYPICRNCGERMRLIYQFNPENYLEYAFGQEYFGGRVESGPAWIFQCRRHLDQFGFCWQCH